MLPKDKQVGDVEVIDGLFKEIKFYLIGTIDDKVIRLLTAGGGKRDYYLSEMVTYAIADDCTEADFLEAKELFELPVVTSRWVILSARCGVLLPTNAFSPETDQLLSGVVACPSQLSRADSQTLWSLITAHGGECQLVLNKTVTHLITTKPSGPKYECALRHGDQIKIVTPDWLTKCVSDKQRTDETRYHPRLLVFEEEIKPETPPPPPLPAPPTNMDASSELVPQKLLSFIGQPPYPSVLPPTSPPPSVPTRSNCSRVRAATSPESFTTREALARMVANRLNAGTDDSATIASPQLPPGGAIGGGKPRSMLRNITNGAGVPAGLTGGPRMSRSPKSPRSPSRRQKTVAGLSRSPKQLGIATAAGTSAQQRHSTVGRQLGLAEMPTYYGHDPTETIPGNFCLIGCVFYMTDYHKYLDASLLDTWREVIYAHGGQVDESYSNRVTHVLCEHQKSDVFQLALRDGKRLVTAHWLDNCLLQKKMEPPYLALHFPSPYAKEKPCGNQIICVSNFEGEERTRLKHMIHAIGAKYTGYMTRANSALIIRRPGGTKYEKALQWRLPIVNVAWLNEIVLGDLRALKLPIHSRFQQFTAADPFLVELWRIAHLLEGWKIPVRVSKETWKKFQPSQLLKTPPAHVDVNGLAAGQKRKSTEFTTQQAKKLRLDESSDEQAKPGMPVVLITSLSLDQAKRLQQEICRLGGSVSTVAAKCSHLVAAYVARTVKFLVGLGRVRHVVTPNWVEESAKAGRFVDETMFMLKDEKAEATFNFRLADSLARIKRCPLFQNLTFYVSPGVTPSKKTLADIVESYRGTVLAKRPSVRTIRAMRNDKGEPLFVYITCDNDLHLCADLTCQRIPVHNTEFILSGVIRQEIDFHSYRIA